MIIRRVIPLILVTSMVMTACGSGGSAPAPTAEPTQPSAQERALVPTDPPQAPATPAPPTSEPSAPETAPTATQPLEATPTSASPTVGATETAEARRKLRARIDVAVMAMGKGKQLLVTLITPQVTDPDKLVVTDIASGQPIAHDGFRYTTAGNGKNHNFLFVLKSDGPTLKQGSKVRLTGPIVRDKTGSDVPLDIEATVIEG